MRKLIFLFAIIILCSSIYADPLVSGSSFYASLKLIPILPSYTMYGSLDGINYNYVASERASSNNPDSAAPNSITSQADLNYEPIIVYIKVIQFGKVHYMTSGFTLSITATELKLDGTSDLYKTLPPIVVEDSIWADSNLDVDQDGESDFISTLVSAEGSTVVYTVSYPTGIQIPAIFNGDAVGVGGFAFKWLPVESLPTGSYRASVTMTYLVN